MYQYTLSLVQYTYQDRWFYVCFGQYFSLYATTKYLRHRAKTIIYGGTQCQGLRTSFKQFPIPHHQHPKRTPPPLRMKIQITDLPHPSMKAKYVNEVYVLCLTFVLIYLYSSPKYGLGGGVWSEDYRPERTV